MDETMQFHSCIVRFLFFSYALLKNTSVMYQQAQLTIQNYEPFMPSQNTDVLYCSKHTCLKSQSSKFSPYSHPMLALFCAVQDNFISKGGWLLARQSYLAHNTASREWLWGKNLPFQKFNQVFTAVPKACLHIGSLQTRVVLNKNVHARSDNLLQ